MTGPIVQIASDAQGVWTWDVLRDRVFGDAVMARLFGIPEMLAAQGVPVALFVRAIAAEDADRLRAAIDTALATGAYYREVFRVDGDDGRKLVMASGQCYFDEEGKPYLYPGMVTDLSRVSALSEDTLARIEQLLMRMHEVGSRELIEYMIDMALEEVRDLKQT